MLKTLTISRVWWALLVGWFVWPFAGVANAATLTVTNTADSGVGSLRQAITNAANGDTINVTLSGTIKLTSGMLVINKSLTIAGTSLSAKTPLTLSGNYASRILDVTSGTVVVSGFGFANGLGEPGSAGGAIRNASTLTLNNCFILDNRADNGGGIYNGANATLTLNGSALSGNMAIGAAVANGGAIANYGTLAVNTSTFYRNHTLNGDGAGIYQAQGSLLVNNSTLNGNSASFACSGKGGALAVEGGTAEVDNATISGNSASASFGGGGIFQSAGTLTVSNSIVAGNSAPDGGADCKGIISAGDFNLVQDTTGCTLSGVRNVTGQDPLLGQLQDNGGPTFTMALLSGSPALDTGTSAGTPPAVTDQRGAVRPTHATVVKFGDGSDIGAFEANDPAQSGILLVNTLSDHDDGVCGTADCTLREAINTANSRAGDDIIRFATGISGTITLDQALPNLMSNIILPGPDAPGIKLERSQVKNTPAFSIFVVSGNAVVTVSGLTLQHGRSQSGGGVVVNAGSTLSLARCTLMDNEASASDGGGIFSGGVLTLSNCTLARNIAPNGKGGGVASTGTLTFSHCTLTGNSAASGGGLDIAATTSATINGSLFAGNSAPLAPDCQGAFTSGDYNLVQDPSGCVLTGANNVTGQNPLLGPLQDNGGPTPTCALLSGSPALDTGGQVAGAITSVTDQRGALRPTDNSALANPTGGDGSDIGAFEADVTQSGVLVVNTTDDLDDGACTLQHCSLREAINAANANPNAALPDEIRFSIPGVAPFVIAPSTALPTMTEAVIINGTSQPGFAGLPIIEISGISAGAGVSGLTVNASGCQLRGLSVTRFAANGITLLAGQNVVENCRIGVPGDATSGAAGNAGAGIFVDNVPGNTIGSATAGLGNLISGNGGDGVVLRGNGANNNLLIGNSIGLAVNGTTALANDGNGIALDGATGNTIGGTSNGASNIIAGNRGNGIYLQSGAISNVLQGNKIGDATGAAALGNGDDGVLLNGASSNTIGGAASGAGNVIAGNGSHGVQVTSGDGNSIRGNAIFSNVDLGIELSNDGPTANDALDADTGPNQLQNYPVITGISVAGTVTTINGTLHSQPNAIYILDFYRAIAFDPSGYGEGDIYLAAADGVTPAVVTTDANGDGTFAYSVNGDLTNQYLCATATDSANNTSEFSLIWILPTISISNVTVTEGNSGSTNAVFTVTLSAASNRTISVSYATADGTAVSTGTADYGTRAGTLTFVPGQTVKTVTVPVVGDLRDEDNEAFFLNLSNSVNAAAGNAQARADIVDDDLMPTVSVNDVSVVEGNSGNTNAVFTITLSAASSRTISVNYATAAGTAQPTGSADYGTRTGTLTFNAGQTVKTVTVPVVGDLRDENDETFFLNLSNPVNASPGDTQGTATIVDDDKVVTVNDVTITEGNSGIVNAVFKVTLSSASTRTISMNYATADGTASAAGVIDYGARTGTLTFVPGQTVQTVVVPVVGDLRVEGDETFFLNLTNLVNATATKTQGKATIIDDEPMPVVTVNDVTITEGNSGFTNAVFKVSLSTASTLTVSVSYATADGTASAGAIDYGARTGTLTFTPGQTLQTVVVPIIGDVRDENDETFFLNLSNPVNSTIGKAQSTTTIVDDDPMPVATISDVSVTEGNAGTVNAVFKITLSSASTRTISLSYATADGTASAAGVIDYGARSGTLSFIPGQTVQTVVVPVVGDLRVEGDETFFLNLTNLVNATATKTQATATIVNDDTS